MVCILITIMLVIGMDKDIFKNSWVTNRKFSMVNFGIKIGQSKILYLFIYNYRISLLYIIINKLIINLYAWNSFTTSYVCLCAFVCQIVRNTKYRFKTNYYI